MVSVKDQIIIKGDRDIFCAEVNHFHKSGNILVKIRLILLINKTDVSVTQTCDIFTTRPLKMET